MTLTNPLTPRNVLISVYHKDRLPSLISALQTLSPTVNIYSTGGTASAISALGAEVTLVEDLTQSPSMLGGRVKTLHPKVFGGILARREIPKDLAEVSQAEIPLFDWVIVDLYPFEEYAKKHADADVDHSEVIEKIDIGGVSLIRAAAKNYQHTLVVSRADQLDNVIELISSAQGVTDLEQRRRFAARALELTSRYDQAIARFLADDEQDLYDQALRYGENPHQRAVFNGDLTRHFEQLNGPELSYNNLIDLDAALHLIRDFRDVEQPTVAILKHTNPCGLATRGEVSEAYRSALSCDPTSAFGGVIISDAEVDLETATQIDEVFYAALAAPSYTEDALKLLTRRSARVILRCTEAPLDTQLKRSLLSGEITQETDQGVEEPTLWRQVTRRSPSDQEVSDLSFALRAVKHLKSNAIALVKDAQLIGMGCGQPSRIDALNQAIEKAQRYGFEVHGSVLASDAFFPFSDCVTRAAEEGVNAVIQPGGSRRDQESVEAADQLDVAMMMTGVRHFRH